MPGIEPPDEPFVNPLYKTVRTGTVTEPPLLDQMGDVARHIAGTRDYEDLRALVIRMNGLFARYNRQLNTGETNV